MRARSAAPEGGTSGRGHIEGVSRIIPESVPASIRERLAGEHIDSLEDWRALGPARRRGIWGVTARTVALIDRLAREELA